MRRQTLWRDIITYLGWGCVAATFLKELINRVALDRSLFNERWRWFAHFTMSWGFVGLTLTSVIANTVNPAADYVPITTPYRILGNVTGALLLIGSTIAILRLIFIPSFRRRQTFGDIWFIALMWLAGVTGFPTE